MLITSCGNSEKLARSVAKKLHVLYSPLTLSAFPDGDIYLKFNTSIKGKKLVIIQSFYPDSEKSFFNVLFAAETAKDLGAKKVILVAPYLAYMRQDKRFHPGEAVSSRVMAKHLNMCLDKIITIDPHLHRYRSLKDIFRIEAVRLTANPLIEDYIRRHKRNSVIIGPDWESYQWAEEIAKAAGIQASVLQKTRFSSRHVAVKMINPIPIKGKNVFIVDDIISTGHTIAEAAKKARKLGAKSVTAIGVHGIFAENALAKMKKAGVSKIVTTNCIEHQTNGIEVSGLIVRELKKEL